ncbi:MAG TPA: alpha/beta hydrolase [Acetobacteraceae bacterium]|nr:alpha/beta hydrolase [Acetobacteraceae bacterium]
MSCRKGTATIVLVHGAWADGSSWSGVAGPLLAKGFEVVAAPIPLTSLSDDAVALERVLERTSGPVVLVAHAYAGAVIASVANVRIRSLVFVAALAPDEGETVADVFYRGTPHAQTPRLVPDDHGFVWLPKQAFGTAFAQNVSPERAALLAATQRPIALACIQEKALRPAWKLKPSWYLIAEQDRMISPATQYFMAKRMRAQIRSEQADHAPSVSAPGLVVDMILEAARADVTL